MAFFSLNSDITIGSFRFSGAHEVRIKRSIHSYADSATIIIPHKGKIKSASHSFPELAILRTLINDGDAVTINLGYNGVLNEEFRGFVKRRGRGMPMVVECEGFVRTLRLGVNYSWGTSAQPVNTTASQLLTDMLQGTGITLQCPVDFPLKNFYAVNQDGCQVCDFVKQASDGALSIFFIQPNVLFCGLVYTPYVNLSPALSEGEGGVAQGGSASLTMTGNAPTVQYRLGWNVVKDNWLNERTPSEPTQIILNGMLANGMVIHTASKDKQAKRKLVKLLNNVPDQDTLGIFAQEKEYRTNYTGMEGGVNGFLQPFALPGYNAYIQDDDDSTLNGTYLVESTEVSYGIRGARRRVTVGPLAGFTPDTGSTLMVNG